MGRRRPGRHRATSAGGWAPPVRRRAPPLGSAGASPRAAHLRDAGRRIRSGNPLDLLAYVSGLLSTLDPRSRDPFADGDREGPGAPDLVRSLAEAPGPEAAAMLCVIAALEGGPAGEGAAAALAGREDALPGWLRHLGAARAHRALEAVDALGDGEDVIVGVTLPGGHELTALLVVDHNAGSVAADGFVIDRPVAERVARLAAEAPPDMTVGDIAPADARARLEEAIAHGALIVPPFTTESWPAARPLLEWIARLLPDGGEGYARREWTQEERDALADRFFASASGARLDDEVRRRLLDSVLWYGADYGKGDPMLWSPRSAEILLLDWIPRKIIADPEDLLPAPELLAAFSRFCHAERGVRAERTAETLDAIEAMAGEYRDAVTSPRLQGPLAILAAAGAIDPGDPRHLMSGPTAHWRALALADLRDAAGGADALAGLDARPLPDEPLDLGRLPADVRARVAEVGALADGACDALFDVQMRTACRRLLARLAAGEPGIFRGAGRADTAAAGLVWVAGKVNGHFRGDAPTVHELAAHLGVGHGAVSRRGDRMLELAGIARRGHLGTSLGMPELLVSSRRAEMIEQRDRLG